MGENKYAGFSEEHLRRIALKKVYFRMSVSIHMGIFITTMILMLILNLIFTPTILWIIFPFFAWLIGVSEHITAYLVYARGVYPGAKRAIIFHLVAYFFVILLLFIINILVTPDFYWALFPAIFWGTGLTIHFILYFIYHRTSIDEEGTTKSRTQRAVEREMEKMRKRLDS